MRRRRRGCNADFRGRWGRHTGNWRWVTSRIWGEKQCRGRIEMTRPLINALKLHGIVMDLAEEDVPADRWSEGRNIYFRNGETWRVPGIGRFANAGRTIDADV